MVVFPPPATAAIATIIGYAFIVVVYPRLSDTLEGLFHREEELPFSPAQTH